MHPRLRDMEHGTYGVRRKPDDDGRPPPFLPWKIPVDARACGVVPALRHPVGWSSLFRWFQRALRLHQVHGQQDYRIHTVYPQPKGRNHKQAVSFASEASVSKKGCRLSCLKRSYGRLSSARHSIQALKYIVAKRSEQSQ